MWIAQARVDRTLGASTPKETLRPYFLLRCAGAIANNVCTRTLTPIWQSTSTSTTASAAVARPGLRPRHRTDAGLGHSERRCNRAELVGLMTQYRVLSYFFEAPLRHGDLCRRRPDAGYIEAADRGIAYALTLSPNILLASATAERFNKKNCRRATAAARHPEAIKARRQSLGRAPGRGRHALSLLTPIRAHRPGCSRRAPSSWFSMSCSTISS